MVLTKRGSILSVFAYFQFLTSRYGTSTYLQRVMANVHTQVQKITTLPVIGAVIATITRYIGTMGQQSIEQQVAFQQMKAHP
eukprot:CAMPEP_0117425504 /NCGR_PEP_ID=MMETSP0758-20121206/5769_1 /TAXON_ID=63605 /ORGANISM="Percolomonas cosmopolitus, Strain AE-1 (ATCC 50343)" /LENGTH=81 /DNA_ID=CAMNT_0005210041 /DNA_START=416 /DNA_END=657 /DNA_ORIENTATION=-